MSPLAKLAFVLAATGTAMPAVATATPLALDSDRMTAAVRYADLDLASAKGQEALDRRISRAAYAVCRVGTPVQVQACRSRARAATRPAVELAIARVTGGKALASSEATLMVGN